MGFNNKKLIIMKRLDKIKHAKRIIDAHFKVMEIEALDDDEIVEASLEIAGAAFTMAEGFGYNKLIKKIIDNE